MNIPSRFSTRYAADTAQADAEWLENYVLESLMMKVNGARVATCQQDEPLQGMAGRVAAAGEVA